jgi:hypothetical protein
MVDVDAAALTDRLRTRFAAAQGRVAELPDTVRSAAQRLVERVRTALDLPSRSELIELSAKLEELDRRIADLASARVADMARPVPSLPAPAEDAVQSSSAVDVTLVAPASVEPVAEAAPAEAAEVEADAIESEADADAEPVADAGAKNEPGGRRRKTKGRATANKTSRR